MIDHKSEVLKIYPDAYLDFALNENCDYLPIGFYVCRFRRLFGLPIPIFPIKIAHGWTEQTAWENALNTIKTQTK